MKNTKNATKTKLRDSAFRLDNIDSSSDDGGADADILICFEKEDKKQANKNLLDAKNRKNKKTIMKTIDDLLTKINACQDEMQFIQKKEKMLTDFLIKKHEEKQTTKTK